MQPYHVRESSIEGVGVNICFAFAVSDTVLVVYWCDNNLVQGCGIQLLVQYGKGCILGLLLFQSKQSTHNVFCHFLSRIMIIEKLCIVKPSFLHLSLVLGCLQVGDSNRWDVLLIVIQYCCVHCC